MTREEIQRDAQQLAARPLPRPGASPASRRTAMH